MNTIEELKKLYEQGKMEMLYSGKYGDKDCILMLVDNGFSLTYQSKPKWDCVLTFEYLDNEWYRSESYENVSSKT